MNHRNITLFLNTLVEGIIPRNTGQLKAYVTTEVNFGTEKMVFRKDLTYRKNL